MKLPLKELQQSFKSHLMRGDVDIARHIESTSGLANDVRLAIYGNAYYLRLVEALQQDYEAIYALLGDDEFDLLCKRYIDAHPSKYFSLRWFGQYMSEFLVTTVPYNTFPYLAEMAILEWCFIEAFDADDAPVATVQDVTQVAADRWPELIIGLHPSVQMFSYNWNILPVWKAATHNETIPELTRLDKSQDCFVWRQQLTTQYRTAEPDEVEFMKGVLQGENFSALCERLATTNINSDQVPLRAASILKVWLEQGIISFLKTD